MSSRVQVINTPFFRRNKCLSTCRSFRTTTLSKLSFAAVFWRSMSVSGSVRNPDLYIRSRIRWIRSLSEALAYAGHAYRTWLMLLTNDFVVIVSTDFSKAFNTVSHQALFDKMGSIDLPDEIYNWMGSYYSNRSYVTRYLGSTSGVVYINASIVQGSGFGPPSYIVVASDLHPKHECNVIDKFADDTYLLVGSNHLSTATEEFEHISGP